MALARPDGVLRGASREDRRPSRFGDPNADPEEDCDRLWSWLERRQADRVRDAERARRLALLAARVEARRVEAERRRELAADPWCRCGHPKAWHEDSSGVCGHGCACVLYRGPRKPCAGERGIREFDRFLVRLDDECQVGRRRFRRERRFTVRREADRYASNAIRRGMRAEVIVEPKAG